MDDWEKRMIEWTRRGNLEKVKFLQNLNKIVLPSMKSRIQQNDKSVLHEMVLPSWVSWELLYEWAMRGKENTGKKSCIFCSKPELGIAFKGKHICYDCLNEFKLVQVDAGKKILELDKFKT